jgi:hypothetical protein
MRRLLEKDIYAGFVLARTVSYCGEALLFLGDQVFLLVSPRSDSGSARAMGAPVIGVSGIASWNAHISRAAVLSRKSARIELLMK